MLKRSYKTLGIVVGALLGIALVLVLVAIVGGPRVVLPVLFFFKGTTNPYSLLKQIATPGKRIPYGPNRFQFGELRSPDTPGKHAVAILIHGGCWRSEINPLPVAFLRLDLLRPLATALLHEGIATWSIEYRRLGDPGGGWLGTYQDISTAVDFLPTLAAENNLDVSNVVVIGHSAGGHLAEWVAGRGNLPKTSDLYEPAPFSISGVVDIDGPPDLAVLPRDSDTQACGSPVIRSLMAGLTAEVPSHYREGSIAGQLPTGVPQVLFYADKNEFMSKNEEKWAEVFTSYASVATRAGDKIRVVRLKGAGHFDGVDPMSKSWPIVLAGIKSLLHTTTSRDLQPARQVN